MHRDLSYYEGDFYFSSNGTPLIEEIFSECNCSIFQVSEFQVKLFQILLLRIPGIRNLECRPSESDPHIVRSLRWMEGFQKIGLLSSEKVT